MQREKHCLQRAGVQALEGRWMLAAPAAPVITEPEVNGQVVSNFDVHMEVDPAAFFDADRHAHQATSWQVRETSANGGAAVWQALNVSDPLSKVHIHFGDGTFIGTLAGQTALLANRGYVLHATFTDSNNEVSTTSQRSFTTAAATTPVPGEGTWIVREGYALELAAPAQAFRMAVNIAFVPNPGPNSTDPIYYVTELYGSVKVVNRAGQVSTYAAGLLDYNPSGPISGSGEQGLSGLAIDPITGDLFVGMLWNNGTSDATRGAATLHYPKVERLHSNDGGKTMATRTLLLNMQPETQGQSHMVSNISIGPDGKLYVHMGDGFNAATALDLNMYRGKVLRMNLNGTAPSDNPFYNGGTINARDYIYTSGHRNPFGGAWRASNNKHWVVENGNGLDRMVDLTAGASYGWAGNDSALSANSKYVWNPSFGPVNMAFVQPQTFGGSLFPASSQDDGFVTLSGPTYAAGPQDRGKFIAQFTDLDTLTGGKLAVAPVMLLKYNGTGRASVVALAAGPDGLYFSDFYRDDGVGGATVTGSNIYRVRYVDFHPNALTASAGNAKVTLNWTNEPLATRTNVYRFVNHGDTPTLIASNVSGTSYIDNTALNGTSYHYFVRATNAGGESSDSNEVHAAPAIPSSFTGTASADIYYLKRNGANLDLWIGSAGIGAPTYTYVYASAPALKFIGNAGGDTLTIDNSAGNALASAGISFDGGADADTIHFLGSASGEAVVYNSAALVIASGSANHSNVETRTFQGNGGGDALTINGGKVVMAAAQKLASLTVAAGATIDLRDHDLVLDYSGASSLGQWTGTTYDGVSGLIRSGRNDGTWDGTGMVTSMSDAVSGITITTLAVGEATDALGIAAAETVLWNGQIVDGTCVLVKYTYMGDIDLNGQINGDDYFHLDSNVLQSGVVFGYNVGDVNLDGEITGDDYNWLDSQIISQGPPLRNEPAGDSEPLGLAGVSPAAMQPRSVLWSASNFRSGSGNVKLDETRDDDEDSLLEGY